METSVTHFSPLERAILDDWLVCTSFSLANSIYFIDLCIDPDCAASAWLRRFLMTHELFGDRSLISEKWRSRQVHSNAPTVKPLRHVFPVVLPRHGVGMLVPLFVNPAPSWSASDAFASFRFESPDQTHLGPVSPLALQGLEGLLRHVEKSWEGLGGGPLPLRWRTGYAISIGCPVHFEAIDGDSLQVPLLIALLREICTTRFDVASPPRTPFGEGPVFSTGTLAQDGKFGHIDGLLKKLDAFVREFGGGSPALLTKEQQVQLNRTDRGRELLRGVRVVTIESISDLLTHPEIQPGIERLTGPPHPTEIDSLLAQIRKLNRSVWFRDAASIANWILPHVNEAPYRWEVLMHSGLNLLHRGEYVQAEVYLGELEQLILDRPALLGVDERATAAEAVGSLLFDKAEPERGLALLDAVKADLALCSVATRARALGGYCQLLRFAGRYDEAIIAGEEAVRLAQIGFASEAGRDLNYLIHALLRRAANVPHSMKCDFIAVQISGLTARWKTKGARTTRG